MTRLARLLAGLLLAAAPLAAAPALAPGLAAQEAAPGTENAIGEALFPPELVMQHQQRLRLTGAQRTTITAAIQQAQARVVELQWRLQDEVQRLAEMLDGYPVNEERALAQTERILAIERDIKRAHLQLLIRIKNALTREQITMLQTLK
jgi:Spy/CpxP family protein refolding chaperone